MFATTPSYRLLLIENLKAIQKMTLKAPTIDINFHKNCTIYFRPANDRIIHYNFTCVKKKEFDGILDFLDNNKKNYDRF